MVTGYALVAIYAHLQVECQVMRIFKKHNVANIPPIALIGMIESPSSLISMREICQEASRKLTLPLVALVFGSDDYCASLGTAVTTCCPTLSHSTEIGEVD